MNVGSLFSGAGLLDYGLELAGFEHAWFCEREADRRELLRLRWPGVPVYDDVRGIGADSVQRVDVIAGGFPCKGASTAGKRNGFDHAETVLWREMFRAIRELRPRYALLENVANILALKRGAVWGEVLADLASIGYDTTWDCIPAAAVGAPHLRDRVFAIAADTDRSSRQEGTGRRQAEREGSGAGDGQDAGGDGERAAADPHGSGRKQRGGRVADPPKLSTAERDRSDAPDPQRNGVRAEQESERGSSGATIAGSAGEAPADAHGGRQHQLAQRNSAPQKGREQVQAGNESERRGVRVEWGTYGPAVRRWERVQGPAPEPLVRRMDDRAASRVERSRLSALGDGVQVQVAEIVGRMIRELDTQRNPVRW